MNWYEALDRMKQGDKVRLPEFDKNEYIEIVNNKIVDESGFHLCFPENASSSSNEWLIYK